jgi:formylglycine-generating enzyme required for sulfatase activity
LTWNDAVAYCRWLTESSGGDAEYRLPTEAEWEFACRAGTVEPWHSGTETALREYAWLVFNSSQRPQAVGRKRPNALGLYDMHGNTKEWCADRYQSGYYAISPSRDPMGPLTGETRVVRGGRAPNAPHLARSASRHHAHPSSTFEGGFRVARDL